MTHRAAPSITSIRVSVLAVATVLASCSHDPRVETTAEMPVQTAAADKPVVSPVSPPPPPPAQEIAQLQYAPPPSPVMAAPAAAQAVSVQGRRSRGHDGFARKEMGYLAGYAPHPYVPAVASTNKFPDREANGLKLVADQPISTFSVDVDTASYAYMRRQLTGGNLPSTDAVRVEELVNYFPYKYAVPTDRAQPFGITTELMPNPWKASTQLVHIGVRGFDIQAASRPPANVVLLIDMSGSMQGEDRLELLQKSFRLFAAQLRPQDHVAIVGYAGGAGVLLEPTSGADKHKILDVINNLRAGGSTAGHEGLQKAYELAQRNFNKNAVNRVILATDGDFNVGISDPKQLEKFIVDKRKTGIYLSILGVGEGNLNDAMMQRLSQSGNGNAAYIDTLLEARKAMSEELGSTMFPIANDVKVQVEFNPAQVAAYRLVGYETRMLEKQDFNDDKVDAGDMGAGHTVTAIYEITPASADNKLVDPLRYQAPAKPVAAYGNGEVCLVKVRYKLPGESTSRLVQHVVKASAARPSLAAVPEDQRFAVAVAAFGQRLRGEKEVSDFGYGAIADLANGARGADPEGYRSEFVKLVRMADTMSRVNQSGQP